mmetsp:Transcript_120042/g.350844  ORF Transcript_120042/g.350844 Transcript_120042/m.350844 type:complete len:650 (-) Transcript_120042:448-2397(-)
MARPPTPSSHRGRKPQGCSTLVEAAKGRGHSHATAAHVRLNRRITAAAECSQLSVLELVQSCCQEMSLVNASTAWHCIAQLDVESAHDWKSDTRIAILQRQTTLLLPKLLAAEKDKNPLPRCVSTITWSCAKTKLYDAVMFSSLGDLAVHYLSSFKPFELANVIWGFAKLQVEHIALFQQAHDWILVNAQLFQEQSLSMAAWAFAAIHFGACHGLLCRLADVFVSSLRSRDDVRPVSMVNLVWALATAGVQAQEETLQALGNMAAAKLQSFKTHELSILLWAFARLSCFHEVLFMRAMVLISSSHRFQEDVLSRDIVNYLWAFARYSESKPDSGGQQFPGMIAALRPTLMRRLPMLNLVELSSSVWAISKLVHRWGRHPAADSILVEAAKSLLADPQRLLGMSRHSSSRLLSAYSEFFGGCQCAALPCRQLVEQLEVLCASFKPDLHAAQDSAETAAVSMPSSCESTAAVHEVAEGMAQRSSGTQAARERAVRGSLVEPVRGAAGHASLAPLGQVPEGQPNSRPASGGLQTQVIRCCRRETCESENTEPSCALPRATAWPSGSGLPEWESPPAAEVPTTWLALEFPTASNPSMRQHRMAGASFAARLKPHDYSSQASTNACLSDSCTRPGTRDFSSTCDRLCIMHLRGI